MAWGSGREKKTSLVVPVFKVFLVVSRFDLRVGGRSAIGLDLGVRGAPELAGTTQRDIHAVNRIRGNLGDLRVPNGYSPPGLASDGALFLDFLIQISLIRVAFLDSLESIL